MWHDGGLHGELRIGCSLVSGLACVLGSRPAGCHVKVARARS